MFSRVVLRRNDPASRRSSAEGDIESQPLSPTADPSAGPEMAEHPQGGLARLGIPSRFRFSSSTGTTRTSAVSSDWPGTRTARTSRVSRVSRSYTYPTPRPSSSHYPDDDDYYHHYHEEDLDSSIPNVPPLPSRYSVVVDLPGTTLDLPGLQRSWTHEESSGAAAAAPPPLAVGGPRKAGAPTRSTPKLSMDNPYGPLYPPIPTVTLTEPEPVAQPTARANRLGRGEMGELFGEAGGEHERRAGRGFNGPDPAESQLAGLAEDGRRRRHRRHRSDRDRSDGDRTRSHHHHHHHHQHRHRRDGTRREGHNEERSGHKRRHKRRKHRARDVENGDDESEGPHPKHFMFCFPWVKDRKVRSQIVQCAVSSLLLVILLSVCEYTQLTTHPLLCKLVPHTDHPHPDLGLSVKGSIKSSAFKVLLILIILIVAIFFCQGAVRLCMSIFRPKRPDDARRRHRLPKTASGPGGYAIPREPIRVVLARDEEAVGIESETAKTKPPAYGLWRESVRVDPNRIYWQRNPEVVGTPEVEERDVFSDRDADDDGDDYDDDDEDTDDGGEEGQEGTSSDEGRRRPRGLRRPPSYVSEDGVSYVVEARPRPMVPAMDVPLPVHPAERGRVALPARW